MKKQTLFRRTVGMLSGLTLAGLANASVIPGSGTPSSTQLGVTDAVAYTLADSGPGHALVVPYFSAQGGQMSVLHLVNTDLTNGKAVKLRWRGAGNGDNLLSLYVLLSPGDTWTAAVTAGADGKAQLTSVDNTCTYPQLVSGVARPFNTSRLNPVWTTPVQANNTREGLIEAIVAADIPSAAVYGPSNSSRSPMSTAIQQVNGLPPCTVKTFESALLNDFEIESHAAEWGFATPTGGVSGSWYIIDVPGSTTFSGAATAFRAVNSAGRPARGNYVVFPQNGIGVDQPERFTSDPLMLSAGLAGRVKDASGSLSSPTTTIAVRALFNDFPDLSTPYYLPASPVNARTTAGDLSKILSASSVSNQYATDTSISAKTDWVLSMPTKRYSVGVDYNQPATSATVFSVVPPAAPNNQFFHSDTHALGGSTSSGIDAQSCTRFGTETTGGGLTGQAQYNREGQLASDPVFIGGISVLRLCGTSAVMAFGDNSSSALNASVALQKRPLHGFIHGWWKMTPVDPATGLGLPLLGAAFIKLSNPVASPGVSSNYGITWPHGITR